MARFPKSDGSTYLPSFERIMDNNWDLNIFREQNQIFEGDDYDFFVSLILPLKITKGCLKSKPIYSCYVELN